MGVTLWRYDGTTRILLGLAGPGYTRNDGYKNTTGGRLNEAGQAIGRSDRFSGAANMGATAWLYDGGTTIGIGLIGAEHTRNDGYVFSDSRFLTEAGQVVGLSNRFNGGSADLGQSVWFYNGTNTIDIGLTGSEQTKSNGYKYSAIEKYNDLGQVIGSSYRYNGGSADLGQSAWFYNGATTINVGLVDSEHSKSGGYKFSRSFQLNEGGQVLGYSNRYNGGSTDMGLTTWLHNGATTSVIGLTGSEYTKADGYKYSWAYELNDSGRAKGFSYRYNGGSSWLGQSAWIYDGATTIEIGLRGTHTPAMMATNTLMCRVE